MVTQNQTPDRNTDMDSLMQSVADGIVQTKDPITGFIRPELIKGLMSIKFVYAEISGSNFVSIFKQICDNPQLSFNIYSLILLNPKENKIYIECYDMGVLKILPIINVKEINAVEIVKNYVNITLYHPINYKGRLYARLFLHPYNGEISEILDYDPSKNLVIARCFTIYITQQTKQNRENIEKAKIKKIPTSFNGKRYLNGCFLDGKRFSGPTTIITESLRHFRTWSAFLTQAELEKMYALPPPISEDEPGFESLLAVPSQIAQSSNQNRIRLVSKIHILGKSDAEIIGDIDSMVKDVPKPDFSLLYFRIPKGILISPEEKEQKLSILRSKLEQIDRIRSDTKSLIEELAVLGEKCNRQGVKEYVNRISNDKKDTLKEIDGMQKKLPELIKQLEGIPASNKVGASNIVSKAQRIIKKDEQSSINKLNAYFMHIDILEKVKDFKPGSINVKTIPRSDLIKKYELIEGYVEMAFKAIRKYSTIFKIADYIKANAEPSKKQLINNSSEIRNGVISKMEKVTEFQKQVCELRRQLDERISDECADCIPTEEIEGLLNDIATAIRDNTQNLQDDKIIRIKENLPKMNLEALNAALGELAQFDRELNLNIQKIDESIPEIHKHSEDLRKNVRTRCTSTIEKLDKLRAKLNAMHAECVGLSDTITQMCQVYETRRIALEKERMLEEEKARKMEEERARYEEMMLEKKRRDEENRRKKLEKEEELRRIEEKRKQVYAKVSAEQEAKEWVTSRREALPQQTPPQQNQQQLTEAQIMQIELIVRQKVEEENAKKMEEQEIMRKKLEELENLKKIHEMQEELRKKKDEQELIRKNTENLAFLKRKNEEQEAIKKRTEELGKIQEKLANDVKSINEREKIIVDEKRKLEEDKKLFEEQKKKFIEEQEKRKKAEEALNTMRTSANLASDSDISNYASNINKHMSDINKYLSSITTTLSSNKPSKPYKPLRSYDLAVLPNGEPVIISVVDGDFVDVITINGTEERIPRKMVRKDYSDNSVYDNNNRRVLVGDTVVIENVPYTVEVVQTYKKRIFGRYNGEDGTSYLLCRQGHDFVKIE